MSIEITIERGGSEEQLSIPEGTTGQYLVGQGFIAPLGQTTTRRNGDLLGPNDALQAGDIISQMPKSGKQGACRACGRWLHTAHDRVTDKLGVH